MTLSCLAVLDRHIAQEKTKDQECLQYQENKFLTVARCKEQYFALSSLMWHMNSRHRGINKRSILTGELRLRGEPVIVMVDKFRSMVCKLYINLIGI